MEVYSDQACPSLSHQNFRGQPLVLRQNIYHVISLGILPHSAPGMTGKWGVSFTGHFHLLPGSPRPSQPFPVVLQLKDQRDGTWEHPTLHKESRGREICPHSHPLQGPLERRDTLLKSSLPVSFTGRPTAQSWLIGLVCLLLCWFFLFAFFFLKNSHSIKCMILKCAAWWVLARSQDCATTTV